MSEDKKTRVRTKPLEQQSTPELLELVAKIKTILAERKKVHEEEAALIPEL